MSKKKTDKKYIIMMGIVYLAVFAIYNIITLVLFKEKNDVFWISYAFMCVCFVANVAVAYITFQHSDAEAIFMNIPLMSFSIFYFGAEVFVSFVFMLFRFIASPTLTVVIQSIMLLVFIIFAVLALMSKNVVEDINKNIDTKVRTIKNLAVQVKVLEDQCLDKELKKELHKVSEGILYSDPMTTDVTEEIDDMINSRVKELKYLCSNNQKNEALQTCFKLQSFISERNMLLKNSK